MNINEPWIVSACGRGLRERRRHCRLNSFMQWSLSGCIRRCSNAVVVVVMHSSLG